MLLNCGVEELLRVPWTARRSNKILSKEISPEYSLEELMVKLKLQYFVHLMQRTDSLERTLKWGKIKVGGEGDNRGWDGWMTSLTQWIWVWASSGSWWWTGKPGVLQSMGLQRVGQNWETELTGEDVLMQALMRVSICESNLDSNLEIYITIKPLPVGWMPLAGMDIPGK